MRSASLAFVLLFFASAGAEPLVARNGDEIRLLVAQKPRKAVRLKPEPQAGWRLELGGPHVSGVAELIDVTPGTPARTIAIAVSGGAAILDQVRFTGGHAYHVQVHLDGQPSASGFVYLVSGPPAKAAPRRGTQRIRFDKDDAPAPASDELQPSRKGGL
jgi:hypothetical protein